MKRFEILTIVFVFSAMLFTPGCKWEPGIDKGKFLELNRTVQDLKTAITAGEPCDEQASLQQRLASGIVAVKDKAASKAERDLISACSRLLTIYQDGLLLCRSRTHLTSFQFVPKGRIYVTQELDPLVEKYDLPTERHVYGPTGQRWRSISVDSLKVIWESALVQIKNIENMVNYS
ncbi:MAG TPA: hypothetical protein VF903_03735 [Nitrospirota bacterium]